MFTRLGRTGSMTFRVLLNKLRKANGFVHKTVMHKKGLELPETMSQEDQVSGNQCFNRANQICKIHNYKQTRQS